MKQFGKRFAAVLLAAAALAGTGLSAAAADKKDVDYAITVNDRELTFKKNGKAMAPYEMRAADVKLSIDDDDDFLVCFTDTSGQYRGISLGSQRALTVAGELDALTLAASLMGKAEITLAPDANVAAMTVSSKGDVTIEGDVGYLLINGSARVNVTGDAVVGSARLTTTTAKLTADEDANVQRITTVDRDNVTGPGIGVKSTISENGSYDHSDGYAVKLTVEDSILYHARSEDGVVRLRDINADDIALHVQAIGTDDKEKKHYLSGNYTWSKPNTVIYDADAPESDTFSCDFLFTPSNSEYETRKGAIKLEVILR